MKTIISICIALFFTFVCACERVEENYLSENVEYAAAQYDLLIEKLEKNGYSQQICLTVRMSDGSWPEEYDLFVTVTPPLYTEKEQLIKDFADGLRAFSREAFGICIILREMRNGKHWRKSIRKL